MSEILKTSNIQEKLDQCDKTKRNNKGFFCVTRSGYIQRLFDDIKEMAINKCKFVHFYVPYIFPLNTDKIGNRYFKFKILNFCGLSCTKAGGEIEETISSHP